MSGEPAGGYKNFKKPVFVTEAHREHSFERQEYYHHRQHYNAEVQHCSDEQMVERISPENVGTGIFPGYRRMEARIQRSGAVQEGGERFSGGEQHVGEQAQDKTSG